MAKKVNVDEVADLMKQGYTDADIIKYLEESGYSPKDINDAVNQARVKMELAETAGEEYQTESSEGFEGEAEAPEAPVPAPRARQMPVPTPAPSYGGYYPQQQSYQQETNSTEAIEEIAEGIIEEKWSEFKAKFGDISELKSNFEARLNELSDRVKRIEAAMDRLHVATLSKADEQSRSVQALSSEVEALEGTLSKVIQPLVSSVKDLKENTDSRKKKEPAEKKLGKPSIEDIFSEKKSRKK
ncbi:MAG: hypothetical protein WC475_03830 [Candidatus Paceibacterota bacterium]